MSHFPGAVVIPSTLDLDTVLAPYNEQPESAPLRLEYTRQQAIENERVKIEDYANGRYAEYLADPDAYAKNVTNPRHLQYLKEDFPKKLQYTDEELYAEAIKYNEPNTLDADGNVYTTYPKDAHWDWYVTGGRWHNAYGQDVFENTQTARTAFEKDAPPYVLVDPINGWFERGRMGWFGMSSGDASETDWREQFFTRFDEIATAMPSAAVHIVDFHI